MILRTRNVAPAHNFRRSQWCSVAHLRHGPSPQHSSRPRIATSTLKAAPSIDAIVEDLPIREVIHDITHSLDHHSSLVLQAPPGAGKTTTVPLALLLHNPNYLRNKQKIMVLEPRRVAAKAAARRMASLLGEPVGQTVGYRVKLESRVSAATQIEVITEGILLRMLQQDPTLESVGALLLDEFHERSVDADTALALALDVQTWTRPDLRLIVMSATLGGGLAEDLQQLMTTAAAAAAGDGGSSSSSTSDHPAVPVIVSEGRSYPVKTHFLGRPYLQKRGELESAAASAVLKALSSSSGGGDVLVFMPGVSEIKRLQQLLQQEPAVQQLGVAVVQLHGSMSPQQQDEVIRPNRSRHHRRVVISTPIAESSITIDGVTAVVDSGLHRAPVYDPATGISRLVTQRISQDSAEQRRGRAGRTQPGTCYRLWSAADQDQLLPSNPPEITTADLAPLSLTLASWGCLADVSSLHWLDPPDYEAMHDARLLLRDLAAVDDKGGITDIGRRMCSIPVHPRFAHLVLRALELQAAELGCVLAALLSERDLFRASSSGSSGSSGGSSSSGYGADLTVRLRVLAGLDPAPAGFDSSGAKRVLLSAQQMIGQLKSGITTKITSSSQSQSNSVNNSVSNTIDDELDEAESSWESEDENAAADNAVSSSQASVAQRVSNATKEQQQATDTAAAAAAAASDDVNFSSVLCCQLQKRGLLGALVAAAYPDRIAQLKSSTNGRTAEYVMSSGRAVSLPSVSDPLAGSGYVAVAELIAGRDGRNDRITLGAELTTAAIQTYLKDDIQNRTVVFWASSSKAVLAKQQRVLGSLVLSEQQIKVDDEQALPVLIKGLRDGGYTSLPISAAAESWRLRAAWLHEIETAAAGSSDVPDMSEIALMNNIDKWLMPHLIGVRNKAQLQKLPWLDIFKGMIDWSVQQHVESCAPSHLLLPTGSSVPIRYSSSSSSGSSNPTASVKMQEVFGLSDTPLLGSHKCKIPLVLELLSPAGRPLQVTSNLASFWSESYTAVKKEMKGRYPKHFWPDDPANTAPTKMTKKQLAAAAAADGNDNKQTNGGKAAAMTTVNKKKR